ncbi:MAG: helix-turn-helix domain-containing protein [Trueperaceae bacterium]|nr:helix-turn-helix domain-containing protein [Trueperaceae bacterium]
MSLKWDERTSGDLPQHADAPEPREDNDDDYEYDAETLAVINEVTAMFTSEEVETGIINRELPAEGAIAYASFQEFWDDVLVDFLEDSIGEALRTMRERHEFSLSDAAEAQGISRARAHQIEQPSANLRLDTILRAASAYGYHVQVVFTPKDGNGQAVVAKPAWVDTPDAESGT